jgi:branched-subunit amino acid transport protein
VAAGGPWHVLAAGVAVVMMVFTRMLTASLLAGVASLWIVLG